MKTRNLVPLILVFATAATASPATASEGRAGLQALREKRVAFWPHYNWIGTDVEALLAARLRPGDHVVCSSGIGLKADFRSSQYRIDPSRVLLHLEAPPESEFLASMVDPRQAGIGGLFIFWEDRELRFGNHDKRLRELRADCRSRRFQLCIGMNHAAGRYPGNFETFAGHADLVSIGFDRAPIVLAETAAKYFLGTAARLRRSSSLVSFDAVIPLAHDGGNLDELGRLIGLLANDFDSFTFEFAEKAGQVDAVAAILEIARGSDASSRPGVTPVP